MWHLIGSSTVFEIRSQSPMMQPVSNSRNLIATTKSKGIAGGCVLEHRGATATDTGEVFAVLGHLRRRTQRRALPPLILDQQLSFIVIPSCSLLCMGPSSSSNGRRHVHWIHPAMLPAAATRVNVPFRGIQARSHGNECRLPPIDASLRVPIHPLVPPTSVGVGPAV